MAIRLFVEQMCCHYYHIHGSTVCTELCRPIVVKYNSIHVPDYYQRNLQWCYLVWFAWRWKYCRVLTYLFFKCYVKKTTENLDSLIISSLNYHQFTISSFTYYVLTKTNNRYSVLYMFNIISSHFVGCNSFTDPGKLTFKHNEMEIFPEIIIHY